MKQLKFIHLTKTAGTTIEQISKEKGIKWGKNDNITGYNKEHALLPNYLDMRILNKYDWFMVVRNPFTRVVSTVNWAFKRMKENRINIYVNSLRKIISKHKNSDLNTIFNSYINYSLNNLDNKGNHFTPQHLYLNNNLNITIIKYENLNYEFNNLMKKYKLNLKIPNKSYNKSKVVFKLKDISQDNIILIEKIYKQDFIQFGYPLQSNINDL